MVKSIRKFYRKIINSPFFDKNEVVQEKNLDPRDYEFMGSLSSAIMQIQPQKLHYLIIAFAVVIASFLLWASLTKIDEIARGQGTVIPSGQNKVVQNLEGGIITEIVVTEGQEVQQGDLLLRIRNIQSLSTAQSITIRSQGLQAKIQRLNAQLSGEEFIVDESIEDENSKNFLANEQRLFEINQRQFESKISAIDEQLVQKKSELSDAKQIVKHQESSLEMIHEEIQMTAPMVERGVRSRVDFLQLQRQSNQATQDLNSAKLSIVRLNAEIEELQLKRKQIRQEYESTTQEQLNETQVQLQEVMAQLEGLSDQVLRTNITAPQNGIVKKLFVNTIGGVVQPAQDLVEIVPTDNQLLVEVKIKPSDIAFIYHGQKAIVKFSAYDFAIYGGFEAKVVGISPDTITKDNERYYLVRVETTKNFIERNGNELKIIPGMMADVDILTGKKSILDYILKPILKTTQYTFTER